MRKIFWSLAAFGLLVLSACVTINVYFPAAEAQEGAREFVEKVIGDEMPGSQAPVKEGGGMALLSFFISSAQAQTPDITIRTPAIQAIQSRMAARFDSTLRAGFDAVIATVSAEAELEEELGSLSLSPVLSERQRDEVKHRSR